MLSTVVVAAVMPMYFGQQLQPKQVVVVVVVSRIMNVAVATEAKLQYSNAPNSVVMLSNCCWYY